jgi:O-antigen/teichoic acid export membrane protein
VLPLLAVSIVGSWVLFRLYGPTYAFSWPSALLMSLGLAATVLSGVLGDLLVACGVAGTRWLTWSSLATAAVNVGLGVLLVPAYAVDGALAATCCSAATAVILRRGALTALSRRARAGLA